MKFSKIILMSAFLFGANAVSAQSADNFAGHNGLKNQTLTSISSAEINYNKGVGGRGYRCPEYCS